MTVIPERLTNLDQIHLDYGSHNSYDDGHCAMEVVAWLAGEGITDAPACASPVLQTYVVELNDRWENGQRQKLLPYLPRMVGTAGDSQDEARSYLALDWLVRTFTPAWLELAGLAESATELRSLRRIADMESAGLAGPAVRISRDKAAAARAAARAAAGDAAWTAAGDAAWTAARAAAGDAAGDAAGTAAWTAARTADWTAAWAAARAAARAAAWTAAGDAARDAARTALQPTVEMLQQSALDLLDRMIDPKGAAS